MPPRGSRDPSGSEKTLIFLRFFYIFAYPPDSAPKTPRTPKNAPTSVQEAPRRPPRGPRTSPRGPKRSPRGPKRAPRRPQEALRAHLGAILGPSWGHLGTTWDIFRDLPQKERHGQTHSTTKLKITCFLPRYPSRSARPCAR